MDVSINWYVCEPYKKRPGPYAARVVLSATVTSDHKWHERDRILHALHKGAKDACEPINVVLREHFAKEDAVIEDAGSYEASRLESPSGHEVVGMRWTVLLHVKRPKDLPADNAATLGRLGLSDVLDEGLFGAIARQAIEAALKAAVDEQRQETELRWANTIVDHWAELVSKRAWEVFRYDQRLAALRAEYKVEKAEQARRYVEEQKDEPVKFANADEPVPAHVVRAALAALPKAVEQERDGFYARTVELVTAEALAEAKSKTEPKE